MGLKNTYKVYKTGSLSGVTIHDVAKNTSKKFTYIKAKRGEQVLYLDRNHNLVEAADADTFSLKEAHKISLNIRQSLKGYKISVFSTTKRISHRSRKSTKKESNLITSQKEVDNPEKKPALTKSKKKIVPQPTSRPVRRSSSSTSLYFIGMKVLHKTYGEGKVIQFNNENCLITVRFSDGEKKFRCPSCFQDGYLEIQR